MHGDEIQANIQNDHEKCNSCTLGRVMTKPDDQNKNYALICSHKKRITHKLKILKISEHAYIQQKPQYFCNFDAMKIQESFSKKCDVVF